MIMSGLPSPIAATESSPMAALVVEEVGATCGTSSTASVYNIKLITNLVI